MSYFRPRNFLLVLVLAISVILSVLIVSRYRPESPIQMISASLPDGVDVALKNIDYTHMEDGQARWRLVAQKVEHVSQASALRVESPHISFYDGKGDISGSLESQMGEISDDYQHVELRDQVILKSSSGHTFFSEQLFYDHDSETASTDSLVRLESEGFHVQGKGLLFSVKTKKIVLNSQVEAVFYPDKLE